MTVIDGASGTFTISVNSINSPTLAEAAPTTVCSGSAITLTAGGGGGGGAIIYWYSGSCNGTYVGSGTPLTVYPTSNTTYFAAYYKNGKLTSCVATTSVTVNQPPTDPTGISGTTTICNGSSTLLTAIGGSENSGCTYQWFTGSCGGTQITGAKQFYNCFTTFNHNLLCKKSRKFTMLALLLLHVQV